MKLEANAVRWKVEEFHRGVKQLTGIEVQCRKARIQRNHIACAILAWTNLKKTIYPDLSNHLSLKYQWLSEYLIEELKHLYSYAACLTLLYIPSVFV